MEDRSCPVCGIPIRVGRSDKRFCSGDCRSRYHNSTNKSSGKYVRKINKILRGNRSLMRDWAPSGKAKARKSDLVAAGFNFNYFTHIYRTKTKKTYFFCYEYGWLEIDGDFIIIVRKDIE